MNYTPRWHRFVSVTAIASAALVGASTFAGVPAAYAAPAKAETLTIAEIQGTGKTSPKVKKKVTTTGIVTAVYSTGGFDGYFIQTEGSSDLNFTPGQSDGIFVASPKTVKKVKIGEKVQVTGVVEENYGLTQIKVTAVKTGLKKTRQKAP